MVLGQESKLESIEWRRQCFIIGPSKENDVETKKDKDKVENPPQKKKILLKETTTTKTKDSVLSEMTSPSFGPKATTIPSTETQDPKGTLPLNTKTQAWVDLVTPTPLSSKVPKHKILEEAIPLNEYKFDHSKLAVVKRTWQ